MATLDVVVDERATTTVHSSLAPPTASAIDARLERVRAGIRRVGVDRALAIQVAGGILVDIRPVHQRLEHGEIPDALVIGRNVLEWRLDPTSPDRHPIASHRDMPFVVFCQEGYASSLAVADLRELGLREVRDMIGGYGAWAAAGLPTRRRRARWRSRSARFRAPGAL